MENTVAKCSHCGGTEFLTAEPKPYPYVFVESLRLPLSYEICVSCGTVRRIYTEPEKAQEVVQILKDEKKWKRV